MLEKYSAVKAKEISLVEFYFAKIYHENRSPPLNSLVRYLIKRSLTYIANYCSKDEL